MIIKKNTECIIPFQPMSWDRLTPEAKQLTQRLLAKSPNERISAEEALQHEWFKLTGLQETNLPAEPDDAEDMSDIGDDDNISFLNNPLETNASKDIMK